MSLFTPATNQSAYLKCGILGFQGSGKTYTAVEIALGLHKHAKSTKPVMFLDTETGSDWSIPRFREAGVELQVSKTRAFEDLLAAITEAEQAAEILIVDSVSHFWNEIMEAYRRKKHITGKMAFHHWMPIKAEWARFSTAFVNCKLHFIVCGRAGWMYDYEEDEDGKKELIKTGTKMRAEGEFGFEPSLVLEMERIRITDKLDGKKVGKVGAPVLHRAHVIKDRRMDADTLDGQSFDNPTFEDFMPHIAALNLGGEHLGVDDERNSESMFESESGESYAARHKRRTALWEEINGELEMLYPGTGKAEKIAKAAMLKCLFGTYSASEIQGREPEALRVGLDELLAVKGDTKRRSEIIEDIKAGGTGRPKPEFLGQPDTNADAASGNSLSDPDRDRIRKYVEKPTCKGKVWTAFANAAEKCGIEDVADVESWFAEQVDAMLHHIADMEAAKE